MHITQFFVGGLDQNCSYICRSAKEAVIVDPTGDVAVLFEYLIKHHLTLTAVWLTHTHFDHYDQLPEVIRRAGPVPIYVHEQGAAAVHRVTTSPVHTLHDNDVLALGDESVQVLHTPGHSPDGVCFYFENANAPWLVSGDTLFVQGCGQTTPTTAPDLYTSLQRLAQLPGKTTIYPGHDYGPTSHSTIATERTANRFLRASTYKAFYQERFPK